VKPNKVEKRNMEDWKVCNPKLINVGKKYFLATAYEKNITLNKTEIDDQKIISVDLGLTNSAVCSLMKSDGTIIDRLFINQAKEKDRLDLQLKRVKMAHYKGIRINRINPAGTSKLAFDGSGEVKRNNQKDIATFTTGKQYHADLNASYNIGARYFIRELLKTYSEKKKSALMAKVPQLSARTQ